MKANELMIGDIIHFTGAKYYHPCNVKVLSLYNREGGYPHASFDLHDFENNCALANISKMYIEPIPLTAEILEKNGWKEAQFWHEYKDGKNTIQSCLPDMRGIINGVEIQNFKCEYIHQYQHLLRLCGRDELADNFKIE